MLDVQDVTGIPVAGSMDDEESHVWEPQGVLMSGRLAHVCEARFC